MQTLSKKGFTLIELLLVMSIIALLATVLFPNLLNARRAALDRTSQVYARNVSQWATSWLASDQTRRTSDLPTSCVASEYISEGALSVTPVGVIACEVLVDPNGPGTFGARITSSSGKIIEVIQ